jgi:Ferritin-like domain
MKRTHRNNEAIPVSEAELFAMTSDMKDAHHDTLPALQSSFDAWTHSPTGDAEHRRGFSRRSFLTRSGLLAAGGLLVASGDAAAASTIPRLAGSRSMRREVVAGTTAPLDVRVAALAASLENLAVSTYASALSAATAGKLGKVPNAVATFVETAMAQHKDHAAAWNALVSSGGYKPITAPNAAIAVSIKAAFAKVTDIAGVAKLALTLEDAAAATYLEAIGVLSGSMAIETAATIQPVEMQHAAILNFVLGQYPVPQAFSLTAGAATLTDAPAVAKR